MGRLFSVDLLCCLQVITTMADVLTSVHDRRFFTFNFDWTIFPLDRLSALPAQTCKLMSQLWSALWRRRRRGAGQRGRGGKNSITQWWWGQMFSVKKDNGQCSGFIKACSVSVTIWFWASLSFFVLFATGVEREHQGSLQGATSSALRPRSVLHLWIRVGQHMITNNMKYCMTIEVIFFCAWKVQNNPILWFSLSGLRHQKKWSLQSVMWVSQTVWISFILLLLGSSVSSLFYVIPCFVVF